MWVDGWLTKCLYNWRQEGRMWTMEETTTLGRGQEKGLRVGVGVWMRKWDRKKEGFQEQGQGQSNEIKGKRNCQKEERRRREERRKKKEEREKENRQRTIVLSSVSKYAELTCIVLFFSCQPVIHPIKLRSTRLCTSSTSFACSVVSHCIIHICFPAHSWFLFDKTMASCLMMPARLCCFPWILNSMHGRVREGIDWRVWAVFGPDPSPGPFSMEEN